MIIWQYAWLDYMEKVAIITDSNSGITNEEAKEMGVFVLPMPFMIDDEEYYEGINLNVEQFFELLKSDRKISTSQPSVAHVTDLWKKVLEEYESSLIVASVMRQFVHREILGQTASSYEYSFRQTP